MAERLAIVRELKRALKERGLTYADVAAALRLSLPTVKRLFASGDFSLARVDANGFDGQQGASNHGRGFLR